MAEEANGNKQGAAPARTEGGIFAVKGLFSGEFSGLHGLFLVVMDIVRLKISRIYVVVGGDKQEVKINNQVPWKQMESDIITLKLSGGIAQQMSLDVQNYLKRVLQDDFRDEVVMALSGRNVTELRRLFEEILSRAIAEATVKVDAVIEGVNAADVPELQTEASAPAAAPGTAETAAPAGFGPQQVRVRVEPVLSPVNGIPARQLQPGVVILVKIREEMAVLRNLQTLLAPRNRGVEMGAVMGTVLSVQPIEFERYALTLELAKNVIGVASISGELKVKVAEGRQHMPVSLPVAEEPAIAGPGLSTTPFVFGAILIFTILAILAYLFFGGAI